MISTNDLGSAVYEAHRLAATVLPTDVRLAFKQMHQRETQPLPERVMSEILDNVEIAEMDQRPICADVGVPRLYVVVGDKCELADGFVQFERAAREATARITKDLAMRSNRCHPLTRANPGLNVGVFAPNIEYRFEPDVDWFEITAVHKGGAFGSDSDLPVRQ